MPLLSYNCAAQKYARCRETVHKSPLISASLMLVGAVCFILLPGALIGIFSRSVEVLAIERIAFPTIGASFPSAAFSLIGLNYTWLAFPVAETAAGALGYIMYRAKKQHVNPWLQEVFKGTRDYEQAIARQEVAA